MINRSKRSQRILAGRLLNLEVETIYGTFRSRVTADEIAHTLRITEKTANRWITNPETLPSIPRRLLEMEHLGVIADPEFEGFCIKDGELHTRAGLKLTPGAIEALVVAYQRARLQDRTIDALRAQIKTLHGYLDHWRKVAGEQPAANEE